MVRLPVAGAGLAGLLLIASTLPAIARAADETVTVRLRHVVRPLSEADAEHLLNRIEAAQTEACGASQFSLSDYRLAIRHTPCWREGLMRTVAQIDDALLRAAFERRYKWRGQP
jgi:UrcA family protein